MVWDEDKQFSRLWFGHSGAAQGWANAAVAMDGRPKVEARRRTNSELLVRWRNDEIRESGSNTDA